MSKLFRPIWRRVTVRGVNIHPSIAKGRMVNAIRVAADFVDRLPRDTLAPEVTAGSRRIFASVSRRWRRGRSAIADRCCAISTRRRSRRKQNCYAAAAAATMARDSPARRSTCEIRAAISQHGRWARAGAAGGGICRAGVSAARPNTLSKTIIRGGTDGSRFTELGLPTPNLSTGQHNPHSPLEWACSTKWSRRWRCWWNWCKCGRRGRSGEHGAGSTEQGAARTVGNGLRAVSLCWSSRFSVQRAR